VHPAIVVLGAVLFALACLGCSYLSARSERKRRRRQRQISHALGAAAEPRTTQSEPQLQQLLMNDLEVIEEQPAPLGPVRVHGRPVGHLRLRCDQPQKAVEAPQFLKRARSAERSRSWKELERTAAGRRKAPSESASRQGIARKAAYDVIEPEPQERERGRSIQAPVEGDLLERILESLREERR
jgi:hypothetical protein